MPSTRSRNTRRTKSVRARTQRSQRSRSNQSRRSQSLRTQSMRANNIYAFRPTSSRVNTPYPFANSGLSMGNNTLPLNNNIPNSRVNSMVLSMNSMNSVEPILSMNSRNGSGSGNASVKGASMTPLNSLRTLPLTQTLEGTLGGQYRISGEVTLTPL